VATNNPINQPSKLGERVLTDVEAVVDRAKEVAQGAAAAAEDAVGKLGEARDAAWQTARKAGAQAREVADQAYQRGEHAAQELAGRVEERPLLALLIAAAAGYALGYLMHARR
jgi:ElaB/YqjD/DUF883 family membrane-anchored ribosome-binding protein